MTGGAGQRNRIAFYMDAGAWPGGAELWLTHLMSGLRQAGWDVALLLSDRRVTDEWAAHLSSLGIDVGRVRPTRESDPAGEREAERALAGFELVHVNKAHPRACLPAIVGARRAGARALVASEHVVTPPRSKYPLGAGVVRRLVRRANGLCDVITVPSDASREAYLAAYGADPARVVTVRGSVDLSRFAGEIDVERARRALGVSPDARVAVVLSRLHEGKGLDTALRAVPRVLEREPRFRLVIVGDGELKSELRDARDRMGLADAVVMTGSRDDVPTVLAAADLLVVPSESETAGIVAMEAGAAGRPVVATNVGGLPEAVSDGETGLLVPPGDDEALAAAVLDVLSDTRGAGEMGNLGRARVERLFSAARLVEQMTDIYVRLLS